MSRCTEYSTHPTFLINSTTRFFLLGIALLELGEWEPVGASSQRGDANGTPPQDVQLAPLRSITQSAKS
jgi:hypothetical protein